MDFLISGQHISPISLIVIGFVIGVLGGFFGVGGSFLAGPALFALGVPMHFVVGTDLAHIVGKSIVAARRHQALGNIDFSLGGLMVIGTIAGVEAGAQGIEYLKRHAHVDLYVGVSFIFVLLSISGFMGWESWKTLKKMRLAAGKGKESPKSKQADVSAFDHVAKWIHSLNIPPMIRLKESGIQRISL